MVIVNANIEDIHLQRSEEDNLCPIISVLYVTHTSMKIGPICFSNVINFSYSVWNYLQITWIAGLSPKVCILAAKRSCNHPFFFEVVYLAAWSIWTTRNDKIFRHIRPTFGGWKAKFIHDITLHSHRMKSTVKPMLLQWIKTLP